MAVPAGQRAQITLADGTKVWLNAQSTLTYSHDFGRNERNVELDGGAYFEVAKNKEIPFYVNTETNQVRVVETHFNVCAYRGSNEFTTTLLEGIVDIYAKGSEHSLTRLGGTRFLFSGTESSERSVLLILIISVGKMVYTVLMILLLTCCLVNWRNKVKIVVENPKVLNYRCTGKFKDQDGGEHVLKVIQKDHSFIYSISAEKDSIFIK